MARRILDVDVAALRAVRDRAGVTLRWKYDAVSVARTSRAAAGAALDRWVAKVEEEWGSCGRIAWVDDEPLGYVLVAPPSLLPGLGDVPTAPASADAVVLAEVCVLPDSSGVVDPTLAKLLVLAMAKDLFLRDISALEAFGTHGEAGRCLVAVEDLDAMGFTTHRAHSTTPRMRMDLRTARTWMDEVELALERLVGAVRPAMKPAVKPRLGSTVATPQTRGLRSDPRAP